MAGLALALARFGPGLFRGGRVAGRFITGRTVTAGGVGLTAGTLLGGGGGGGGGGGDGGRRRRRKALTDTDVRTALTIASAISKKAAENFILMRVRGG